MTLFTDLEAQIEPPFRERREQLYAPAAPFGEAIEAWLERERKRLKAMPALGYRRGKPGIRRDPFGHAVDQCNLEELARRAGTTTRNLRRYANGETRWIELCVADRLAMALDIPLVMLADDFKPKGQTVMRKDVA